MLDVDGEFFHWPPDRSCTPDGVLRTTLPLRSAMTLFWPAPVRADGVVVGRLALRPAFSLRRYSGTGSPEPPSSEGKSLSFGSPSFIGSTVDA